MNTITLTGIHVTTIIGVYAWERQQPRALLIDIECQTDTSIAAQTDDISDALDYAKLADSLREFASQATYQLLEAFADAAANMVLQAFPTRWLKLTTHKPAVLEHVNDVAITITKGTI